jgi:putative tricarboxylic transport membrane protein
MAAMLIHGVQPGPMIMVQSPQFVYDVVAMMLFATLGILFYGLTLTKLMTRVLQVPQTLLIPVILVLCTVGSFAIAGRVFDIWVMLAFGVIGFILRQLNYPMAPLVLGIVLGDLMEKSLRRGLVLSDGSLEPFLTRPISLAIWVTIAIIVAMRFDVVRGALRKLRGSPKLQ